MSRWSINGLKNVIKNVNLVLFQTLYTSPNQCSNGRNKKKNLPPFLFHFPGFNTMCKIIWGQSMFFSMPEIDFWVYSKSFIIRLSVICLRITLYCSVTCNELRITQLICTPDNTCLFWRWQFILSLQSFPYYVKGLRMTNFINVTANPDNLLEAFPNLLLVVTDFFGRL